MANIKDPRPRSASRLRALATQTRARRPKKPRFMQEEKPILFGLTATQIFGLGMLGVALFVGVVLRH